MSTSAYNQPKVEQIVRRIYRQRFGKRDKLTTFLKIRDSVKGTGWATIAYKRLHHAVLVRNTVDRVFSKPSLCMKFSDN